MGQLQWRSDDTIKWKEAFGKGEDGDWSPATSQTEPVIDASFSGTEGSFTGVGSNASFAAGQFVRISKKRGNTTTPTGTWQWNKIEAYNSGTGVITFKYPLVNTYNDDGGNNQSYIRVYKRYKNVTIPAGVTIYCKGWDGNLGGEMGWFFSGEMKVYGTLWLGGNNGGSASNSGPGGVGTGFRGGNGSTGGQAQCGEGTVGGVWGTTGPNGNGGGGANGDAKSGGGGGNAGYGGSGTSGQGGTNSSNASLTICTLGGGGGGGSRNNPNPGEFSGGGAGAGEGIFVGPKLTIDPTTGYINLNGGSAGSAIHTGGAGAGGSFLHKGASASVGSNRLTANAGSGGTAASVGVIHFDLSGGSAALSGTTSPAYSVTQDSTIKKPSGAGILRKHHGS